MLFLFCADKQGKLDQFDEIIVRSLDCLHRLKFHHFPSFNVGFGLICLQSLRPPCSDGGDGPSIFLLRGLRPPRGDHEILDAAQLGKVGAVWHLLRTMPGALDETESGSGYSALHVAAGEGHVEICRLLLAAGAEVDARGDESGLSA